MKQLWKRNAVVGTIVVFVCAAIFLNGKYAEKVEKPTKILGQSELCILYTSHIARISSAAVISSTAMTCGFIPRSTIGIPTAFGQSESTSVWLPSSI